MLLKIIYKMKIMPVIFSKENTNVELKNIA
jgi:hypothetical protein